ncbi:spermidine synthase [Candidatus Kryptobacter tengchongensis]|uniref:Polyamine aminopropyltransferase n=1 Tax=Kryptobacter tengchongensis TaxID=1643429 RepID=A0A656CXZ9_KRYT1|nr:polyamine aminopropyltransferase [Candidatus Kryptobacter tengchongensis]CUS80233.1 spermidine synthase [Candidatus Kryptobacter tengchongensis]CUS96711.1 spermidine synthase [Candidatus Kryptobacter tengchongensis]CUT04273.1 spermidine synthase [Candidatus Kryptobacter tengchongensis]CUT04544.1 spermidine synthase [Candidatus Kryptobacter tengchongensis]CUU05566.1 spermidine synthase [Candidatus Kryptobacter tengchongensis]
MQEKSEVNTDIPNSSKEDFWFTEYGPTNTSISLRVKYKLFEKETPYQKIEIFDSYDYGRVMALDGFIMLTEKDEFIYHEMISHVPLFTHPEPKYILVIGGGDGGAVREILKHKSVEKVELVEIDEEVVNASKIYFPQIASCLEDKRVEIKFQDGVEFIKSKKGVYDIVLIDSPDPIGPAIGLFEEDFYKNAFFSLNDSGILVAQSESPFVFPDLIKRVYSIFKKYFPIVYFYLANVPTYASGVISFILGSKKFDPLKNFDPERVRGFDASFRYYNEKVHLASFALPNFFTELLK